MGKPVERVQHMEVPTFVVLDSPNPKDDADEAEDAEVIEEEKIILPEGS